jgi:hydrogenase-4 component B
LPQFYFKYAVIAVNSVFGNHLGISNISFVSNINVISNVGLVSSIFIAILLVVFLLRKYFTRNRTTSNYHTWGCGYVAPIAKAQYSGRSFSRPLAGLLSFVLSEKKEYKKITKGNIYPKTRTFATQYSDLLEQYIITPVSRRMTFLVNYFQFIQNGMVQYYVIYGLFFILLIFLGTIFNIIN